MSNPDYRYKSEYELRHIKEDAERYWTHPHPLTRWSKDDVVRDVEDEFRRRRVEAQREEDEKRERRRQQALDEASRREERWAREAEDERARRAEEDALCPACRGVPEPPAESGCVECDFYGTRTAYDNMRALIESVEERVREEESK